MCRLLRRSRLDELPELWNILKGEMAFIGPRPLLPETVSAMGAGGEKRGKLRPGLTGWAQVNGNSLLPAADKLALDLWYVSHRSPAIDVGIVIKTLGVMIAGERSEEHTSELQSLMRISYAVFCLNKKKNRTKRHTYKQKCR